MHLAWIAVGNSATALAHARWTGDGCEPQAIRTGVAADAIAVESGAARLSSCGWTVGIPGAAGAGDRRGHCPAARGLDRQPAGASAVLVDPIANRYAAFGDSITWGEYNDHFWTSYPEHLDFKLDTRSARRRCSTLASGRKDEHRRPTDRRRGQR